MSAIFRELCGQTFVNLQIGHDFIDANFLALKAAFTSQPAVTWVECLPQNIYLSSVDVETPTVVVTPIRKRQRTFHPPLRILGLHLFWIYWPHRISCGSLFSGAIIIDGGPFLLYPDSVARQHNRGRDKRQRSDLLLYISSLSLSLPTEISVSVVLMGAIGYGG